MKTERIVPRTPEKAAKIKYSVPMSLWLVENNQRFNPEKVKHTWRNRLFIML